MIGPQLSSILESLIYSCMWTSLTDGLKDLGSTKECFRLCHYSGLPFREGLDKQTFLAVEIKAEASLPFEGSVNAQAPMVLRSTILGKRSCFCFSEPRRAANARINPPSSHPYTQTNPLFSLVQ